MKKYKLIKEYPGSPKIDSIVEIKYKVGYALENSTSYFMTKDKVENYPEFWEEVVEKKEYEILSFNIINPNKSKTLLIRDSQLKDTFCFENGRAPFYCLENILKSSGKYEIHSVKRLSDGEIFTIGDKTNSGTINQIQWNDDKGLWLDFNGYGGSHGGYSNYKSLQHVKQPLLTTEVVEKDYEILSFKTDSGNLSLLQSNGNYFVEDNTDCVEFDPDGYYRGYTVEEELKHDSKIHSVKRMSDGEVFTVGDNIIGFNNIISKINSINLTGEVSLIITSDTHEGFSLKNLKKSKLPLFTTEDGVDIYKGDSYVKLNAHSTWDIVTGFISEGAHDNYKGLKFSTKEAAEEYILMNESKYSINDILASLPNRKCEKYTSIKQMIENLKNM